LPLQALPRRENPTKTKQKQTKQPFQTLPPYISACKFTAINEEANETYNSPWLGLGTLRIILNDQTNSDEYDPTTAEVIKKRRIGEKLRWYSRRNSATNEGASENKMKYQSYRHTMQDGQKDGAMRNRLIQKVAATDRLQLLTFRREL